MIIGVYSKGAGVARLESHKHTHNIIMITMLITIIRIILIIMMIVITFILRPAHLLRVSLLRVLESNFPEDPL